MNFSFIRFCCKLFGDRLTAQLFILALTLISSCNLKVFIDNCSTKIGCREISDYDVSNTARIFATFNVRFARLNCFQPLVKRSIWFILICSPVVKTRSRRCPFFDYFFGRCPDGLRNVKRELCSSRAQVFVQRIVKSVLLLLTRFIDSNRMIELKFEIRS